MPDQQNHRPLVAERTVLQQQTSQGRAQAPGAQGRSEDSSENPGDKHDERYARVTPSLWRFFPPVNVTLPETM